MGTLSFKLRVVMSRALTQPVRRDLEKVVGQARSRGKAKSFGRNSIWGS
jgi:hypothetical protein